MVCLEAEKWQGLQKRTVAVKIDVNSEPELGGADSGDSIDGDKELQVLDLICRCTEFSER
jgi:hypothetical protein